MATKTEDINELSNIISTSVKTYLSHVPAPPTLRPAPPVFVTHEVAIQAKEEILLACRRMISLVEGPFETAVGMGVAFMDTIAMKLAYDMKLAQNVPPDGSSISLAELAAKTGAPEETIVRVMRALTLKDVFVETAPGHFAHTGGSADITAMDPMIGHLTEESFSSGPHVSDVLRENNWAVPEDSRKTAFSRAYNTNKNYFEYVYSDNKPMGTRFGKAMQSMSNAGGPANIVALYTPLESAPKGTTLVDIGGGIGHVAVAAAQKFPNIKCVVQDIGMVVGEGRDGLPEELKGRVEFQENDFLKEQLIGGPGVYYYLRHILHDNPDPACRDILSHIVNVMDSSSRILIDESIVDERMGPDGDKFAVIMDLQMLVMCNSKERTEAQWAALLKSTDERLVVEKVWRGKRGGTGIVEARLA
ncbi:S-adenosyl-L-methionine-dependent methyltransferase [Choiromyces venosus 120613-1]|uniref:S-adenosyl-L-methionine-dependent methyltransferase n=1 Tax=Choiromyces venosus 120613-1 TaxID=1336337 RepID=A0A3N4J167_9PEZI|nr:S-adenosyl-L-methionine-dependent methyltransferase [Choiromyces venosus 120613-1]